MQITLITGRKIWLAQLYQWRTYGALSGIPYRQSNAEIVQRAIEDAKSYCLEGSTPYLISPVVTPIELKPAPDQVLKLLGTTAENYAALKNEMHHEKLPSVTCIGVFDSNGFKQPDPEPCSGMTLVWFQQEFALPVDQHVLSQIQCLDWEALAKDWMW